MSPRLTLTYREHPEDPRTERHVSVDGDASIDDYTVDQFIERIVRPMVVMLKQWTPDQEPKR